MHTAATVRIGPVDLHQIALENDIEVLEADLRKKWSAVLIRWDNGKFEIRVEKSDRPDEKQFALAMTLARYLTVGGAIRDFRLERRGEFSNRDLAEDPAAALAVSLMAPDDVVRQAWSISKRNLNLVANLLNVPNFVVSLKLASLGLLGNASPKAAAVRKIPAVVPALQQPATEPVAATVPPRAPTPVRSGRGSAMAPIRRIPR